MRKAMWLAVVMLLFSGCKKGEEKASEPQFPRLEAGDEALAYHKNESKVSIHGIPKERGVAGAMDLNFIPVGTKLRVIEDAERDWEATGGQRTVRVVPLEGELEGVSGHLRREELRPIAKR